MDLEEAGWSLYSQVQYQGKTLQSMRENDENATLMKPLENPADSVVEMGVYFSDAAQNTQMCARLSTDTCIHIFLDDFLAGL